MLNLPTFRPLCATLFLMALASTPSSALAQTPESDSFVFGDTLPDAPELAARGPYGVGVRTVELLNPDQLDVLALNPRIHPKHPNPVTTDP